MIPSLISPAHQRVAAVLASTCGLIAACGFIAACGSTAAPSAAPAQSATSSPSSTASAPGATTSAAGTAATSTPASQSGTASCLASDLQAQLGASQGTAGTIYQVIELTNTSASDCTLFGYPGVSFVTSEGGSQVGAPATRNPAVKATQLTLAPGDKANVLLAIHDAGAYPDCRLTSADWLRIYPPGDYGSLYVQYKAQTCANTRKSILTVTAVSAGAGSAS
ncbi:MAG TPA: DUF4232 domain-containing protein [Streptosporangiaceae bacterium]|nr:DUF4232 domain-containing protein [Streptosporangiaceae bacterium]